VVWDASIPNIVGVARHPERLAVVSDRALIPVGLVADAGVIPGWNIINGYSGVETKLRKLVNSEVDVGDPARPNLDARIVLFPYDFRLGVVAAAERLHDEIECRLAHFGAAGDDVNVVIVGHSMGGLVARYYAGPLGGWTRVRAILTLGTPHRGAPKAVDVAANGLGLGPFRFTEFSRVLGTWTGLFDLFPTYAGVLDSGSGRYAHLSDLPMPIALGAARSRSMHDDIAVAWSDVPRWGPQMVVRLGWSHPTRSDMTFDGTSVTVTMSNEYFASTEGWGQLLGDGTVPAPSAVPLEMSGIAPSGLLTKHRHGALAVDESLFTMAREIEGYPSLANVRDAGLEPYGIGLDIPELVTGPFDIAATIMGDETGSDQARLWYQVRRQGEDSVVRGELEREDGVYRATVAPIGPPGMLDVKITASNLSGGRDAVLDDSVALFDA